MNNVTTRELEKLIECETSPCVSIYMPTHASGSNGQEDSVRLKNLVRQAEQQLVEFGMRRPDAKSLLQPVRQLPTESTDWAARNGGLALFIAPGVFRQFDLPIQVRSQVRVNRRFAIKPLVPVSGPQEHFFVLTLSQNGARLWRGHQFALQPVKGAEVAHDIRTALNYDEVDRGAQVHSAMRGDYGKQAAVFHGHGGLRETAKEEVEQYFRIVDARLSSFLRQERAPLILAGVDYLLPIYRSVTRYANVLDEELHGNPEQFSNEMLHKRAWELVRPYLAQQKTWLARFQKLNGTGKASDDVSQIVPAAFQGKINALLVDPEAQQWGRYYPATEAVELHRERQSGDEDLLEQAAVQTLRHRGTVIAISQRDLPNGSTAAAVFRF